MNQQSCASNANYERHGIFTHDRHKTPEILRGVKDGKYIYFQL